MRQRLAADITDASCWSNAPASAALTANSVIASWFFRINEAALGYSHDEYELSV